MTRTLLLFVTEDSWREHFHVGIAGINDPKEVAGVQGDHMRQVAISEISGITPGDHLFFRIGGKNARIVGRFRAVSEPYSDSRPLFVGATEVGVRLSLPFRVDFEVDQYFPHGVGMEHIWWLRERGRLWNVQQGRGDTLGRHACISLAEDEAEALVELLEANNPVSTQGPNLSNVREQLAPDPAGRTPLPLELKERNGAKNKTPGRLWYEASLQSLIQRGFAGGLYKDVLGDYSDFIPFPTTGAQTELDVLLYRRQEKNFLWYNILELKADTFSEGELRKIIDYEKWISRTRAKNSIQVHSTGIGYDFNPDVIDFVQKREKYQDRPIRLVRYRYNAHTSTLNLEPIA